MAAIPLTGKISGKHKNLRGRRIKSVAIEFYTVNSDYCGEIAMKLPCSKEFLEKYPDIVRSRQYRDRKAPRLAARRVSRKAREAAKWSDAFFGIGA